MPASGEDRAMSFATFRKTVRHLYEGATPEGVSFRYALPAFDIVTALFTVATSFLPSNDVTEALDVLFGVVILADFAARLLVSRYRLRDFTHFSTWTDIVPIIHLRDDSDRLRNAKVSQSSYFELCRHAVLHRDGADDNGLWRHHPVGHDRPTDHRRHHDFRRYLVLQSGPCVALAQQGAVCLPGLRPAAP
jgi:hypothetical protein